MGIAIALLSLLVPLESTVWRVVILVAGGVMIADAVRKTDWVKEKHPVLSLTSGFVFNESDSPWRTVLAVVIVAATITFYGAITWPPDKEHPVTQSLNLAVIPVPSSDGPRGTRSVSASIPKGMIPLNATPGALPPSNRKVKPKPRLDIDVDVSLLSSISDVNLREKNRTMINLLVATWGTFWTQDDHLLTHTAGLASKPKLSAQDKIDKAEWAQERIQLRIDAVSEIRPLIPKISALRDESIKRFGASDQDVRNLKGYLERFADLIDYEEGPRGRTPLP